MKNINFAQTFKPEKQYISSILNIANKCEPMTAKKISLETGIPMGERSGKVIPHIEYAKFMGLIDYEKVDSATFKISLTELGRTVYSEDKGLRENLTLSLLNSMLCREIEGAPIWDVMFSSILPKYHGKIEIEDAIKELNLLYENKVTRKNFSPFLNSYSDIFLQLSILNTEKTDTIEILHNFQIDKDFAYLYCYILFSYWDDFFAERIEITADEFKKLNFGLKLNCSAETEYKILELLNEKQLIRLNRQLTPYTIMKNSSKEQLLKKLYSELF